MLKNWWMLLLLAGLILPALASEPEAIIVNGCSMMPLRYMSESFGAGIQYNSGTKQVNFSLDYQKTTMTVGNKNAVVGGKAVVLQEAPVIYAGVTYVPARFVSVVIGAQISWDNVNRCVIVNRKGKKLKMHVNHSYRHVPPGLAKKGGVPPGQAKKYGISPGQDSHMKGDKPPSHDFHNMKGNSPQGHNEHKNGTPPPRPNEHRSGPPPPKHDEHKMINNKMKGDDKKVNDKDKKGKK